MKKDGQSTIHMGTFSEAARAILEGFLRPLVVSPVIKILISEIFLASFLAVLEQKPEFRAGETFLLILSFRFKTLFMAQNEEFCLQKQRCVKHAKEAAQNTKQNLLFVKPAMAKAVFTKREIHFWELFQAFANVQRVGDRRKFPKK